MNAKSELKQALDERRLFNILAFLRDQPGYMAAASDIKTYLEKTKFSMVSSHRVAADLVLLQEYDLVMLIADGAAARITANGVDVANGAVHFPGVARPMPE